MAGGGRFIAGLGVSGPQIVNFPARNDTVDFRRQLETKYANDLKRPTGQVYVDFEGDAAWIGEYQRMRANGCDHNTSVQRVSGPPSRLPPCAE